MREANLIVRAPDLWFGGVSVRCPCSWGKYSHVACHLLTSTTAVASVYCSFVSSGVESLSTSDSWWTIELARQDSGRWLITNYGQG